LLCGAFISSKAKKDNSKIYVGFTENIDQRLDQHNYKTSDYSRKYAPWELKTYIIFKDKQAARDFEKYLKSGSGFGFLKKRLLPVST